VDFYQSIDVTSVDLWTCSPWLAMTHVLVGFVGLELGQESFLVPAQMQGEGAGGECCGLIGEMVYA
jgi:hypothetical protein